MPTHSEELAAAHRHGKLARRHATTIPPCERDAAASPCAVLVDLLLVASGLVTAKAR
jgi:hypothetical protein